MTMETNESKVGGLSFGEALEALKKGYRIARNGWGNPISFIYLSKGSTPALPQRETTIDGISDHLFDLGDEDTVIRLPGITALAGNGVIHTGLSPSPADILAEDWEILADPE